MILLIDNYDSFAYNLYQMIGSIHSEIQVVRNNEISIEEIQQLNPLAIIISPGPGQPSEAGIIEEVILHFYQSIPILGVCLGHQAICEAFGSTITHAKTLMHGKSSYITLKKDTLFQDIKERISVARYHSLAVKKDTLAPVLKIIGECDDGEIMAVKHIDYPVYGLQFHPESILTDCGKDILKNFIGGICND